MEYETDPELSGLERKAVSMSLDHRIEFHEFSLVAVHGNADCIRVDIERRTRQPNDTAASGLGATSTQRIRIEIDFPDVDQGISALPVALSGGSVVSEALTGDGDGGIDIPTAFEGMVDVKLVASSGESLRISGERFRAITLG